MSAATCIYCDAPAVRWCDLVLGFTDPDGDGLFSFSPPGHELLTCDAPLCEAHATNRGWVHFKAPKPIGGFETVDYCHTHDAEDRRMEPITQGEAEQVRYRHRCQARGGLQIVRGGAQPDLFA